MEGRRPLLAEVQALVTHTAAERPAAYDERARRLARRDGARGAPAALRDPAAPRRTSSPRPSAAPGWSSRPTDLAIAVALASASTGRPAPPRRRRDGRDRAGRRAAPGARPAAAAGRGGPARASGSRWCPAAATARERRVDGMRVIEVATSHGAAACSTSRDVRLGAATLSTPVRRAPSRLARDALSADRRARPTARHCRRRHRGRPTAPRSSCGCARPWRRSPPAPRCATASSGSCAAAPAR